MSGCTGAAVTPSIRHGGDAAAAELLHGLVSIPSPSRREAEACLWLVRRMDALGFDRAYLDGAGNAVGELGAAEARHTVVLLGHVDTVPGAIPVRFEEAPEGPVLHGRGTVDAKGPLATFVLAAAALGSAWAERHDVRLVVVGAVEEEAATSKGARSVRRRFDGRDEPLPDACVIGEPSGWDRLTLGYKGRLLLRLDAAQPRVHTAGPGSGVATVAVRFWSWLEGWCAAHNRGRERLFDQLLPWLRRLHTWRDRTGRERATAEVSLRLPPGFDRTGFEERLAAWGRRAARRTVPATDIRLRTRAHEPAWQSAPDNALVRSFQEAIREVGGPGARPGFLLKTGTSDMNVVAPVWRCPILAYGPGDSRLDHTEHEHLPLADLERAVAILTRSLAGFVDRMGWRGRS